MTAPRLVARIDKQEGPDQEFLVRSPAVGVADGVPEEGTYLNPREGFLTMRIMGQRHVLQLPRKVQGRVVERFIEDTQTPIDYNQPLMRLSPLAEAAGIAGAVKEGAVAGIDGDADLIPVESPSEGVFYRRPSPESPPYVDVGAEVSKGTVVGLVEVMKCFNQIRYDGPAMPDRGEVVKALVEDACEVTFGQTLFLIRPK